MREVLLPAVMNLMYETYPVFTDISVCVSTYRTANRTIVYVAIHDAHSRNDA